MLEVCAALQVGLEVLGDLARVCEVVVAKVEREEEFEAESLGIFEEEVDSFGCPIFKRV